MRRIRVQREMRRSREDPSPILPLDPRDPDVLRAKRPGVLPQKDRRTA